MLISCMIFEVGSSSKKKKKNMGPAISAGSLLIRSVWFTPKLTNAECNLKYLFSTLNLYDTKIVVEGSAR